MVRPMLQDGISKTFGVGAFCWIEPLCHDVNHVRYSFLALDRNPTLGDCLRDLSADVHNSNVTASGTRLTSSRRRVVPQ